MRRKSKHPKTIIFFGPDGSGKSTQAKLLVEYFHSRKCPVFHVWIRARHSIAFILSEFFVKLGYSKLVKVPSGVVYRIVDPNLLQKMRRTWIFIEFVSVLPWIIKRVYLPRILGYTIIAERYVVDTIVYLGYWLDQNYLKAYWTKILLNFIPREALLIHFDAETEVLTKRLHFDTATLDFITFQRKAYRTLTKRLGAITINTSTCDIKETFERVIEIINRTNQID